MEPIFKRASFVRMESPATLQFAVTNLQSTPLADAEVEISLGGVASKTSRLRDLPPGKPAVVEYPLDTSCTGCVPRSVLPPHRRAGALSKPGRVYGADCGPPGALPFSRAHVGHLQSGERAEGHGPAETHRLQPRAWHSSRQPEDLGCRPAKRGRRSRYGRTNPPHARHGAGQRDHDRGQPLADEPVGQAGGVPARGSRRQAAATPRHPTSAG